jgi:hypothetical protein
MYQSFERTKKRPINLVDFVNFGSMPCALLRDASVIVPEIERPYLAHFSAE